MGLAVSWNAIGMGSWQEAVQIWILLGCTSRLMARVALEMSSAAGMCRGLTQIYSSRQAQRLAARWEWAPLVDSAAGVDVRVRAVVIHRCVVEPVYHREKTVTRSRSSCPRLNSMARLETSWKVALRSSATKTRVVSASAKYWMDSIILLAPSWHPTPCWSVPAPP